MQTKLDAINEELSKADVNNIISAKISSSINSRDFKKKVKEYSSEIVSEVFRLLWQHNNFWKSNLNA